MLRIRALQLRAQTSGPTCGTDLAFTDGLNVLRADNSSGKSTCLQAILYALGLEGMLSPRREVPLPHAMTDSVDIGGRSLEVRRSFVRLEIENHAGRVATVERLVSGGEPSHGLVKVLEGAALSESGSGTDRRDYFVRRPGAAQREAGFHRWLANFLGWELPRVTRTDGSEGQLYLECIFPYFFVEQKHGWLGLQARIPTYFGIRDVVRRSAEFVLGLDAYELILRRQRLESEAAQIDTDWKRYAEQLRDAAEAAAVVPKGLTGRPPAEPAALNIELLIRNTSEWLPLAEGIIRLRDEIQSLESLPVRSVGNDRDRLEERLERALTEVSAITAALAEAMNSFEQTKSRAQGLQLRLAALEEDLQRHKDAVTLRSLGSRNTALFGQEAHCPTCQQYLPDGFDVTDNPMSEEQNTAFIEQEVRTFRAMHQDAIRLVGAEQAKVESLRYSATHARSQVRELKDALIAPSDLPSPADVAARIRLESHLQQLEKLAAEADDIQRRMSDVAARWQANRQLIAELSRDRLSELDKRKIDELGRDFRTQLSEYGFRSLNPSSVRISEETYRPTHDGFDLGFDLSASDMIRSIWAYLLSLAEIGREFETNHLGFLALDEPRQQEVAHRDFESFMRRLSHMADTRLQIMVATSEEGQRLAGMLAGRPVNIIDVPPRQKLLNPVNDAYQEW